MDAVTYPDETVQSLVTRESEPVRLNILEMRALSKQFRVIWTPTFVTTAPDGEELHKVLGYLPPNEFIPRFLLGIGLTRFQMKDMAGAATAFGTITQDHPASFAAPEAVYWQGVTQFRIEKDIARIYEACTKVIDRYPDTLWAKKLEFTSKYENFDITP